MRITNFESRWAIVPVFLIAQALLIHATAGREHPPPPPSLSQFPMEFDQWKLFREDPVATDIAGELKADALLSQTYIKNPTGSAVSLFVAWFRTQSASVRHSPKVCLPAWGWTPEATGEITLDTAAGAITVNRYLVDNGTQRAAVLYWYQMPRRVIANDWALATKLRLVADTFRDRRSDTAIVRVIAWSTDGRYEAATRDASGFARKLYPLLREYLPR